MLQRSFQTLAVLLVCSQIGFGQVPLEESKEAGAKQKPQPSMPAWSERSAETKEPAAKAETLEVPALPKANEAVPQLAPLKSQGYDRLGTRLSPAVDKSSGIPCMDLDILIATVAFDKTGEFRVEKPGAEPEVNRAGTIGSHLAATLNEQRDQLPPGLSPGAAAANSFLDALAGAEKLESLEQFRLRLRGDGSEAQLQNASRVPRIVGTTVSSRGTSNSVEMENLGTMLLASAQIANTGKILIGIDLEKSSFGPAEEGTEISVQGDMAIRAPRIDILSLNTQAALGDGEAAVLKSSIRSWGDKVTETFVLATVSVVK